jgi:uncharacterized membrane protein HdeD (DUF308 family)
METLMVDIRHSHPGTIWPESIRGRWTLFLIEGIVFMLLGIAAVALPTIASLAVAIFLGWLFLIGGVVGLFTALSHTHAPGFWWSLLSAVVTIAAGVVLLGWPVTGAISLTMLLAAYLLVKGISMIMFASSTRSHLHRSTTWLWINGFLDILLALVIFWILPAGALWALGIFVGLDFLFGGIAMITMALEARHVAHAIA